MPIRCRLASLVIAVLALPAADSLRAGCLPDDIPDDSYLGVLDANDGTGADAGMRCCLQPVDVTVPGIVSDVNLSLGVTHTWVGDLVVKLKSPTGTVSTVLSRPGFVEGVDDGSGCCGDNSNWANASILFDEQSGGPSAEQLGVSPALGADQNVCDDDGACARTPASDSGPGSGLDVDFDGEEYAGDWQICIGDASANDVGSWSSYELTVRIGREVSCNCGAKYRGGDRVRYLGSVAAPQGTGLDTNRVGNSTATADGGGGLTIGTEGEVMCATASGSPEFLVSWDGFTGGHDSNGFCECPTGTLPIGTTSGWYVSCFDFVRILPFHEDFETGDTRRWSAVFPVPPD